MGIEGVVGFFCWCSSWTDRPARLPELAEIFAELLSSCGPVQFDAVAKLGHVTLDVELIFLQP